MGVFDAVPELHNGDLWEQNLQRVIDHCEATKEDDWCQDIVRSKDQSKNCLLGHIFAMGKNDEEGGCWWDWFEATVATTYMVYPVNDGENKKYPQPTARERCLAYLKDLRDGKAKTTLDYEKEMLASWPPPLASNVEGE